jgi:ComF family protein
MPDHPVSPTQGIQGPEDVCRECLKMRPYFDSAYSACLYEGPLKELIHKFKYGNRRMLSGVFTSIMLDFIKDIPEIIEGIDAITFVPLHKKRALARGLNQSELLAGLVGKELGMTVINCLEKPRATKNQNELSREERLVNLENAFRVKPDIEANTVEGADMLIIDDVMTTGATLNEASRALKLRGAGTVRCLTLARGI